ncbi:SsgA family sporulation/cell division regulator [Streptomyces sp. NRRL S-244]|uniref:SsgA family sporulation/cell division regulator n=1 Tax=Streptomyces sp. NRRL S-244 TaxID=1463897 RepID=UPI00069135CA|nr:SsgA family sporulation/cell division regulator [Streptomyces sp. NRRL S-244]
MTKSISADVLMRLDGLDGPITVRARFGYRTDRPFEVAACFYQQDECPNSWVFARELLLDGRHCFTGQGDIRIWPMWYPGGRRVFFSLASDTGECVLSADARAIDAWCEAVEALVPRGAEELHFDIDTQLERFLG